MKNKPVFALVCAGGGAHGSYQVGVLKYIHEHFSDGRKSPFQIFAGSSCGSLNTSFYAAQSYDAYASRLWLEELWLGFHVPQYHGNILKNSLATIYKHWRHGPLKDEPMALLDARPMVEVIRKGFLRNHLEKSFEAGTTLGIAVATTELMSGRTCWFLEGIAASPWNLFHSLGLIDRIDHRHVAASCSVPVFLPPVQIGHRYYLDGSVSLERPLSAAISMGATRILSIATDKPSPTELPDYDSASKPKITKVIRMLINRLGHDKAAAEAAQIEMFNRFYEALSKRNQRFKDSQSAPRPLFHEQSLPAHYRPTEIFLFHPSKRIRDIDGVIKSERGLSKKRTSFMFHESFIRELIDSGYEDAKMNHEALRQFLNPEPPKRNWGFFFGRSRD